MAELLSEAAQSLGGQENGRVSSMSTSLMIALTVLALLAACDAGDSATTAQAQPASASGPTQQVPTKAARASFLFCYSPDFQTKPPMSLVYSTTLDSDGRSFASRCRARKDVFLARDSAFCWVTVSPIPQVQAGAWDLDWLVHRCYLNERFCNSERAAMLANWEAKRDPVPLVGVCREMTANHEFLRFTQAIDARKSATP